MKNQLIIITLLICLMINSSIAQENCITISGGYAFGNIEDINEGSTGWRINALYEYIGMNEHVSNGVSLGYIRTGGTFDQGIGTTETEFKSGHWPIYYVPKYTFLNSESTFRPFVKGALGWHFSDYDITGPLGGDIDTGGDSGFYGGLGAGITINFSELVLINLEYEWAYLSNSWYRDGFINSVTLGIGFNF